MKIDKEKLAALAALPDDALWIEVRKIAAGFGFTLPEKTPSHTDMQKLRGAVNGGGKISVSDAVKILNEYKRRER